MNAVRIRLFLSFLALFLCGPFVLAQDKALDRMRKDVTFLASDDCEGRGPGTKGLELAAEYIAGEFKEAGLKPGRGEKGYFQPFTIAGPTKRQGASQLVLKGPQGQETHLREGVDFAVLGLSGPGKMEAPLVFAGYGVSVKEIGYDDFADMDVTDKIVVLLRRLPRWDSELLPFDGKKKDLHAGLVAKIANAETRRAKAVLLVNDASEMDKKGPDALIPFEDMVYERPRSLPVLQMRRDVLDNLLRSTLLQPLVEIERLIDGDLKPRSAALPGWSVRLDAGVARTTLHVKNVVGVLEGFGPLAKETVVIGAHYDHLGWGGPGSLSRVKGIHHGADDNASGTAVLMELARRFGQTKDREGRRLVFIAFSGEERGLLGSKHYCEKEPLFALESTSTMFNLDMVGRLKKDKAGKDLLLIEGAGTSKTFPKLLTDLNNPTAIELKLAKELMPNSDHYPFFNKKIPIIFFWTGTHPEYHRITDTSDRINYEGMGKIVDFSEKVLRQLSAEGPRPEFVSIPVIGSGGRGAAARLGIMPNYEDGKKGVIIGEVLDGGGAHKAGLRSGDLIVEIAGQPVLNIDTYLIVMRAQKAGQPVDVSVLRGEKKLTLKVVPQ